MPPKGDKRRSRRDSPSAPAGTDSGVGYDDWVWWPNEPGRRSRAEEEFVRLPPRAQGQLLDLMKRLVEGTTRFKDVDDLGDGIKELRTRIGNNHYRVLFCVVDRVCVGLTCFYKNQQRTEKKDLDRAKGRRDSYNG